MALEYEEETRVLRRCFFDVQNEVGRGRHEEAYHRACLMWFKEHRVPVIGKQPHRLLLRGEEAHSLFPDLVAFDAISVEMKAVPRHLSRPEFVQLFDYLKCRGDRVGLLVNMGLDRVEVERVVYEPPETQWEERWASWSEEIDGEDRAIGLAVREALRAVYHEHSTGYGTEVTTRLVLHALGQQRLEVSLNPVAKAYYQGREIHESAVECLLVNQRIVLTLSALFDSNDFNANRGRDYLKALNLRWGIAADFGKSKAQIIGLRRGG